MKSLRKVVSEIGFSWLRKIKLLTMFAQVYHQLQRVLFERTSFHLIDDTS